MWVIDRHPCGLPCRDKSGHDMRVLDRRDALAVWPGRAGEVRQQGQRHVGGEQSHRVVPEQFEQMVRGHAWMVRMVRGPAEPLSGRTLVAPRRPSICCRLRPLAGLIVVLHEKGGGPVLYS